LNKKTNIVFFIGQIGIGGTERQITLLLESIDKHDFEYHIFVFNESPFGDYKDKLLRKGHKVYIIPKKYLSIPSRVFYLVKNIKKIQPIIIHSWTTHDNAYAGLLGFVFNIRTIGSVRGSLDGTSFKRMPYLLKFFSLKWVDTLMVNSKSIKKELIDFGVSERYIKILPNCVHLQNNEKKIDNNKKLIVCTIGNLRKNKNQAFFIRVMKRVIESVPNAQGWIIGQPVKDEPHIKNELNNQILSIALNEKIKLLGFQSNTIKILRQSSVFVLPSLSEGLPNTILEAMSIGIPVVASNVGGIPDLINHGTNGFLYLPDDELGFSNCIVNLLNDNIKSGLIGNKGYDYVRKYHNPLVVEKELRYLYRRVKN
tara:strand:+ start:7336 stop:8439 length:1104 start_codon:yes stop_codon:yes gene_type:complete